MHVRTLRPNANLENLKKQAKQLLRSAKRNDPKALTRIRQYFDLKTPFGLKRAQLVLSREYGFSSWKQLTDAVKTRKADSMTLASSEADREFLAHFVAGNVHAATDTLKLMPHAPDELRYEAHHLLRAFVDSNSGHCYKKAHLQIAELLTHERVIAFRNAVTQDEVGDVRSMLAKDAKLVDAEFTAGRGIAQAIHHFQSIEMGTVLLDAGANKNARTTVHHVGDTPVGIQLRYGTVDAVKLLLNHGASPNGGLLKFMHANSMPVLVPLLLMHGWDIDEGRGVRTLLHHDAAHGHAKKMQILIIHGADPNSRDASGRTALHVVPKHARNAAAIRLLLEAGADRHLKDDDGNTPLDCAKQEGCPNTISELLS